MRKLVLKIRLWLLGHHLYGLRHAVEVRTEILVPFTDIATSLADLSAAPVLTKKQQSYKYYCTQELLNRDLHLEQARRAQQKLAVAQRRYAELRATII